MKRIAFGTILVCFLCFILSLPASARSNIPLSQIPGIGRPSIKTVSCSDATIIEKNMVWHGGTYYKDIYIKDDAVFLIDGDATIYGDVYVFGTLYVTGKVHVYGSLHCLDCNGDNPYDYDYGKLVCENYINIHEYIYMNQQYLLSGVPEISHHYGSWKVIVEETCKIPGINQRTCIDCGQVDSDIINTFKGHTYGGWTTIQSASCGISGSRSRECIHCNYVQTESIPALNHNFSSWKTTSKATIFKSGRLQRICANCNRVETSTSPKLKSKVTLKKKNLSLNNGKTYTLKIKTKSQGDKVLKWTTSKSKIATVSKKTGKIKAKKKGTTYITVKMKSGATAKCKVRVK